MDWAARRHPLEILLEWAAPVPLGLATGWAAVELGMTAGQGWTAAVAVAIAGLAAMKRLGGGATVQGHSLQPVAFPFDDELLLDTPLNESEQADALLLDDPLDAPERDARVVRLFAPTDPTPGELAARIEDYLGDGDRRSAADGFVRTVPDAAAALHAALANVRASLR